MSEAGSRLTLEIAAIALDLEALLDRFADGSLGEVIVTRDGRPVARLLPPDLHGPPP